ncbi:protein kinase domain-containing protein [Blastococcus saxobsidens]|uniref:non-specific serine/threonine protein kinase n=1 Tax=Blastococcus saxobsidens (strain DD2) TaxID=1146883 RepID=H6RJG9_BLASD|nr:protein kinase [Blastococcus saxobsidens]CCG01082.1 Two component serine/threonine protein kinase with PASTA sensor [Blastococcus saxobsidens DD2]
MTSRRQPAATRLLDGRYELLSLVATGGMGRVWRARDIVLQRPVAAKVLRSEYTGDATFLARFRAEAQHTALLTHRNIAALFDYGETSAADGEQLAYLVMELVEGKSLAQLLAREGRLGVDRTLDVLRQAASGLAAAHAAGLVHRDVKPGNVLVGSDGTVKLTDFGIAWSAASAPLTQTGQVVGTAHYLSPEQAAGGKAGPASDVYALGMIGFECLAGHRAFDGENSVQIALRQLREPPPPLPADVPEQVRTLVDRALVKEPAERFADGAAFRDAVEDVLAGRPLPPVVPRGGTRPLAVVPPPHPVRRRLLVTLTALLVGAGLGVAALQLGADAPAGPDSGTTEATESVLLAIADYRGRLVAEVADELATAGLGVDLVGEESSAVPADHVLRVNPVGTVPRGTVVTVTYAVPPPEPEPEPEPEPQPAPAPAPVAPPTVDGGAPAPVPVGDGGPGNGNGNAGNPGDGNGNGLDDVPGNGNGAANGDGNGNGRGRGAGQDVAGSGAQSSSRPVASQTAPPRAPSAAVCKNPRSVSASGSTTSTQKTARPVRPPAATRQATCRSSRRPPGRSAAETASPSRTQTVANRDQSGNADQNDSAPKPRNSPHCSSTSDNSTRPAPARALRSRGARSRDAVSSPGAAAPDSSVSGHDGPADRGGADPAPGSPGTKSTGPVGCAAGGVSGCAGAVPGCPVAAGGGTGADGGGSCWIVVRAEAGAADGISCVVGSAGPVPGAGGEGSDGVLTAASWRTPGAPPVGAVPRHGSGAAAVREGATRVGARSAPPDRHP